MGMRPCVPPHACTRPARSWPGSAARTSLQHLASPHATCKPTPSPGFIYPLLALPSTHTFCVPAHTNSATLAFSLTYHQFITCFFSPQHHTRSHPPAIHPPSIRHSVRLCLLQLLAAAHCLLLLSHKHQALSKRCLVSRFMPHRGTVDSPITLSSDTHSSCASSGTQVTVTSGRSEEQEQQRSCPPPRRSRRLAAAGRGAPLPPSDSESTSG